MNSVPIRRAAWILRDGGVVAYPTEGVFGLGCLPDAADAVARILAIKKRDPTKGLILIASKVAQLQAWIDLPDADTLLSASAEHPITWIVPPSKHLPKWIRGEHADVAVRITSHAVAAALCDAADSALVSTSANLSGHAPARNRHVLRRYFHDLVDFIVPGQCGPMTMPTEIRELASGAVLRSGTV
ncbi:MAG: L-threonylcarbamoyladenylate synthase [Proteobacteria bacterium]|nr:L-threonylcarbamoyladenylate synthase [Pseudomonadota bacterium]